MDSRERENEGKQKMPSEGGGDVRRGYWRGEMEKGRSGREGGMHRL